MSNRKRRQGARFKEQMRQLFTADESRVFLSPREREMPEGWEPPPSLSEQLHERCTRREQRT